MLEIESIVRARPVVRAGRLPLQTDPQDRRQRRFMVSYPIYFDAIRLSIAATAEVGDG